MALLVLPVLKGLRDHRENQVLRVLEESVVE
jgi:hypothetical protein